MDTHRQALEGMQMTNLLPHPLPTPSRPPESCSGIANPAYRSAKLFSDYWFLNSSPGLYRQSGEDLGQPTNNSVLTVEQAAGKQEGSLLQKIAGQSGVERTAFSNLISLLELGRALKLRAITFSLADNLCFYGVTEFSKLCPSLIQIV